MLKQALFVILILGCVAFGSYYYLDQREQRDKSDYNMRMVYMAFEWYEMDRGRLPELAFYPDDPRHDNDSLLVVLSKYGVNEEMTVCPTAPEVLQQLGLNYVWNVKLNGRKLHEPGMRDWMLVEMHALSDRIPAPHLGTYTILYTDGKVEHARTPPPGLQVP